MKKFKDVKCKFIIIRVSEEDYKFIQKMSNTFKNVSEYVRLKLGLK